MDKLFPLNLAKPTDELKELIKQYPDYPIVVMADETAVCSDFAYTYCSDISFSVGRILDCEAPNTEMVLSDEDSLKERISDYLCDSGEYDDLSDDEFDKIVEEKAKEYEPYWKDAIIICVGN